MKLAVTIWGNRVSPVFDSAHTLMIADVNNAVIKNRIFKSFDPEKVHVLIPVLKKIQVRALICGAITENQSKIIEKSGIKLVSFISGNTENVLTTYTKTPHQMSAFYMPGMVSGPKGEGKNYHTPY